MELDRLLGNEQLKRRLSAAFRQDRLSHSFLIAGPEGSGKHTLAMILAAAMQCTSGEDRPCGTCRACRKVFSGVHPDVITVDDTEHKGVAVSVVREARDDLYVKPNEGRRKIYLFPRAKDLNTAGQNALLKVMEEPPEYGAYLLLAENPQQLLPTIRSRCVELLLTPLSEDICLHALRDQFPQEPEQALRAAYLRSGGFYGQAVRALTEGDAVLPQTEAFAEAFRKKDRLALAQVLAPMERYKREQLLPVLEQWTALLEAALSARAGLPALQDAAVQLSRSRTAQEILHAIEEVEQARTLLDSNVSPGAICGVLQIHLR